MKDIREDYVLIAKSELAALEEARIELALMSDDTEYLVSIANVTKVMWKISNTNWNMVNTKPWHAFIRAIRNV